MYQNGYVNKLPVNKEIRKKKKFKQLSHFAGYIRDSRIYLIYCFLQIVHLVFHENFKLYDVVYRDSLVLKFAGSEFSRKQVPSGHSGENSATIQFILK